MKTLKIKGIVISENNMGDFDKMVTILTPTGKIGCAAKGARRPKSLLMAGTQYLCFADFLLYKGTNSYRINSCDTIEMFYNIRIDLDKLNIAAQITKIINDVTYENQNTYKILQLLLNTIYLISETDKNLDFILSVFKIRLLCLLGFSPQVNCCISCHSKENLKYFSMNTSGLKCESCGKADKSCIQLSEGSVNAIKFIVLAPDKKVFSFNVSDDIQKELDLVSKLYTNLKLEKEYK